MIVSSNALQLANRLKEVFLNGKWIANSNYSDQLNSISYNLAIAKIKDLNRICDIIFHITYYLKGINEVFEGNTLTIKDQYSFNCPAIDNENDWELLISDFYSSVNQFILHVGNLNDQQLTNDFENPAYGSFQRNIEGQIEHAYYHLGQIVLIRKLYNS